MTDYIKNYEDPAYWHPKCKNFEIVDWKKWEAMNISPPKVFDPPQRYSFYRGFKFAPTFWWHRSCYLQPLGFCYHKSCCAAKPVMGRLTDKNSKVFKDLLGPNPDSSKIPKVLRNSLFWTENNNAPEALISFNRYAWRSQTKEGRVIGVGNLLPDWTNDATFLGALYAWNSPKVYVAVQESPDSKWILLTTFKDPNDTEEECMHRLIYVVQKGDVFTNPDGEIIDHVKPGDIVRVTYNATDLWDSTADLTYMYFARRVAILDESNNEVTMISPHYDELIKKATNKPPKCAQTCCYSCTCCTSGEERWDFQVNHISDLQVYTCSPTPPSGEAIERL